MKRSYVLSFSVLAILPLVAACGSESALVGGECAAGYSAQQGVCVSNAQAGTASSDPTPSVPGVTPISTADPTEPGAPGTPSVPETPSTPSSDAGAPDSASPETPPDGGADDGGADGGGAADGGAADGGADDGGTPTDPPVVIVTPPEPPPPVTCAADELACKDVCVAVKTDGQNCGACGRICPSNICIDGVCQGATPGDIVVIGHDMTHAEDFSTHAKVFKNAVHLPTTDPLRVLAFEEDAATELVVKVRALAGSSLGARSFVFGQAAPAALEDGNLYASWDVVLVDAVSAVNAASYGARWATALDTFTRKGGVLVALDDGGGDVPGFFLATGLVNLGAHAPVPSGTPFVVSAPGDTVGAQLLSPYASFGSSVAFVGAPPSTNDFAWVVKPVTPDLDAPTVVHKIAH